MLDFYHIFSILFYHQTEIILQLMLIQNDNTGECEISVMFHLKRKAFVFTFFVLHEVCMGSNDPTLYALMIQNTVDSCNFDGHDRAKQIVTTKRIIGERSMCGMFGYVLLHRRTGIWTKSSEHTVISTACIVELHAQNLCIV